LRRAPVRPHFPLFSYWGPGAGIASSRWIGRAAERVVAADRPDLTLVYLPHLDYDLQRFAPTVPRRSPPPAPSTRSPAV
jgi:hypothetical protein